MYKGKLVLLSPLNPLSIPIPSASLLLYSAFSYFDIWDREMRKDYDCSDPIAHRNRSEQFLCAKLHRSDKGIVDIVSYRPK
uniref:Uncharacterized protein n=1 Tax=Ascaris lumbricoides TaxID=6252 RepID=A0A0M3I818_ASCLU